MSSTPHHLPGPAEVTGGIVAAGLTALGGHMHTHRLAAPMSIYIDDPDGVVVVSVHIYSLDLQRWLDSTTNPTTLSRERHPSGWVTTVYAVALDCGTRMQLRATTYDVPDTPAALTLIPTQPTGGDR